MATPPNPDMRGFEYFMIRQRVKLHCLLYRLTDGRRGGLRRRGDKVSIHRFKVERDVLPGEYRYRLLVLQGGKLDREFHGSLQLVVEMQQEGRDATMLFPDASDAGNTAFKLNFKYFRRVEGTFRVPAGAKVRTIQARILENGSGEARASQNVNLS